MASTSSDRSRLLRRRALALLFTCTTLAAPACGRRATEPPIASLQQAATLGSWAPGTAYAIGALATFNGITYRCRQAHTSQAGWEPPSAPALWERPGAAGIGPWTNQTSYVVGSGVTFNGLVYRCLQAHNSQPDWTPPSVPALWKVTGDVVIPTGVSGSLAIVFKARNLPSAIADGFGIVQRDPFGDPSYQELFDSKVRSVGEVVHRVRVQGGEVFEFYLQANKTKATSSPSMTAATYSGDPTMNVGSDPSKPDHVAQPLQTASQKAVNIWSLRWESFNAADAGRDGKFDDLTVELRVEPACDPAHTACGDPNLVVSNHGTTTSDYGRDFSVPVAAPLPGLPAGPVRDPAAGEGDATPLGAIVSVGGRVDTLRWSFVEESVDFSAATPSETVACTACGNLPAPTVLGGGLWSLQVGRIHRPRAEAFVSSFGPGVFSNFDTKLTLVPNGIGSQNTVTLFDPTSDAPPITFFETSAQDGDTSVDGRYRDTGTRTYASLILFNGSNVEPSPASAKTAVVTRQTGEQLKFEIINVQGSGATQYQGRLISLVDRNGNATTVSYRFAASSSDSALGGDRKKLWQINQATDSHGVAATFNYSLRSGTSRWVVSSIGVPGPSTLQYQYGTDTANLDRLVHVVYPNGDTANFSRAWEAATQSWGLMLQEALGDAHTWKTVYVTASTYTTADNIVHNQEPNLVRRIVNAGGQQVYRAIEDPNDASVTYFREGADRLTRLKIDARGLPREVALATTVSADPLLASYSVRESYEGDMLGMIQKAIDPLGNARSFGRDSKTRAIVSVGARGGSGSSYTLNAFLEPTQTVDRLGRITTVGYDSKGNPLTITHAVGTPVQAAWTYTYNAKGQPTKVTDPNTKVTDYAYNAAGFLTSITAPPDVSGGTRAVTSFEYDAAGRLSATNDPLGHRSSFTYDGRGRLQKTTYPDGTTELLGYGSGAMAGLLTGRTDRRGILEKYDYDSSRRLSTSTHASGRPEQIVNTIEYVPGTDRVADQLKAGDRVELAYDERLRQVSRKEYVRGGVGLTSQMSWDALDRKTVDSDAYGRRTIRVYDANGRVGRTVRELVPGGVPAGADPAALTRSLVPNPAYVIEDATYDAMNQLRTTTDGRGIVTTQDFDEQGRMKTLVHAPGTPDEVKTTYAYDPAGNLLTRTDPRTFREGQTFKTVFTYSGRNLVLSQTEAAASADAAASSFTYSLTGKALTSTDPRGGVTLFAYDVCDRLISQKNPAGFTTTYAYDGNGNQVTVTNALPAATTFTYDGNNRRVTETNPLGKSTVTTYDDDLTDGVGLDEIYPQIGDLGWGLQANGSAVLVTNAVNEQSLSVRDGTGRLILELNPSGSGRTVDYDAVVSGLVETVVTDMLGNVTRTREDAARRPRTTIDPAIKSTVRTFDATGNILSKRDPNGVGFDCQFDRLGQRVSCVDTQGDPSSWGYDAAGNQTRSTNGANVPTTCTFDFRNRRKTCTDGVLATTIWGYDGNSNVTSITDGETRLTSYTYDGRNLRLTETFPDSTGPTDKVTFTYDAAGRVATRKDQGGNTTTFTYDDADRMTRRTEQDGKMDTFIVDDIGRVTGGTSQRYGTTVARTYDSGGRLDTESVSLPAPQPTYTVSYAHDDGDRLIGLQYPDGSSVSQGYNSRGLLETIDRGAVVVASFDYDDGGRLSTATLGNGLVETRSYRSDATIEGISTPTAGSFAYTYDGAKRKKSETGNAANGAQSFDYDDEGRLKTWSGGDDAQSWSLSPVGDWSTTTRNGATETRAHSKAHAISSITGVPFSYDTRGNLTADDVGHLASWDLADRLRSYVLGESGTGSAFLYDVFGRKVARLGNSTTTVFVHAGDQVVAEYVDGTLGNSYVLGAAVDHPVALVRGGAVYWYSANHLGSIAAVTDAAGSVVERYRYDAHGARSILDPGGHERAASVLANQIGYTGRYHDPATGLIDFRSRQYDPRLGRFLSRDDDYRDGMSLYRAYFVPNGTDPSGHGALQVSGAGRAGGTGAVEVVEGAIRGTPAINLRPLSAFCSDSGCSCTDGTPRDCDDLPDQCRARGLGEPKCWFIERDPHIGGRGTDDPNSDPFEAAGRGRKNKSKYILGCACFKPPTPQPPTRWFSAAAVQPITTLDPRAFIDGAIALPGTEGGVLRTTPRGLPPTPPSVIASVGSLGTLSTFGGYSAICSNKGCICIEGASGDLGCGDMAAKCSARHFGEYHCLQMSNIGEGDDGGDFGDDGLGIRSIRAKKKKKVRMVCSCNGEPDLGARKPTLGPVLEPLGPPFQMVSPKLSLTAPNL
jgi:RHS repeat-associated protein